MVAEALRDGRILLTEDKDFGWLAFVEGLCSMGVLLIRFRNDARAEIAQSVVWLVAKHGPELTGAFTVVQPGHVRISRLPGAVRQGG